MAFPLSGETRTGLAGEIRHLVGLDSRLRCVAPDSLHVTLAFLGATAPDDVPTIVQALRDSAAGEAAHEVVVEWLGAFPSSGRPRVVWAGLSEGEAPGRLARLVARITTALKEAGHGLSALEEGRGFHAHVTLARVDDRPGRAGRGDRGERRSDHVPAATGLEKALTSGTLQSTYIREVLSDLQLMVSEREPGGSGKTRYRPLASIPLPQAQPPGKPP